MGQYEQVGHTRQWDNTNKRKNPTNTKWDTANRWDSKSKWDDTSQRTESRIRSKIHKHHPGSTNHDLEQNPKNHPGILNQNLEQNPKNHPGILNQSLERSTNHPGSKNRGSAQKSHINQVWRKRVYDNRRLNTGGGVLLVRTWWGTKIPNIKSDNR